MDTVRGITFSEQLIKSEDFAHFQNTFLDGASGITKGCQISQAGTNIFITVGYFVVHGRFVNITGTHTIEVDPLGVGEEYCQLVYEVDLSQFNTTIEFNQGYFKILKDYNGYPTITQQDLDAGGTLYQMPFARFKNGVGGITQFTDTSAIINVSDIWKRIMTQNQTCLEDFEIFYADLKATHTAEYENQKANLEQEVRDDIRILEDLIGVEKGKLIEWTENLKGNASDYIHSKENEILIMMNELRNQGFVSQEYFHFTEAQESNKTDFKDDGSIVWRIGTNKESITDFKDDGSIVEKRYLNDTLIQTRTTVFDDEGNIAEVIT